MVDLMPSRSLTRDEAVARKALLQIDGYELELDLAASATTFASRTTIRFSSGAGQTFLDLRPVSVGRISLDGAPIDPALLETSRLPLDLGAGDHVLTVEATMPFRNDGEGLHRSVDPTDGRPYIYGMSFMDAAPTVFACFDQPDLKAPYTVQVTAPTDWVVRANAAGTQVSPGSWHFERSQPLSTYFVTLVAGPYHVIESEHDGIGLGLLARASLAPQLEEQAEEIFAITRASFDEQHRLFGIRYPFGKYDQCFVPEFNAGAMENPGCVTFRDGLIFTSRATRGARIQRATTIAHEMAHQWFGNLVTPAWWDDLWLNESFAEYLGNRVTADVTEYADTWVDLAYARRQWGLVADQSPTTHPVAGNGAKDAVGALQDFDGISYAKGSALLKQLARTMGDEVFFAGVRAHLEGHSFDNATLADLLGAWREAGAEVLDNFADEWLVTAGVDTLHWDREAQLLVRTPPATSEVDQTPSRTHRFRAAVARDGAWELEELTVDPSVHAGGTPYPVDGDAVVLDPTEDTWAVTVPDPQSVDALVGLLPTTTDPQLRAGIWNTLRSGFYNAYVDPARIIDIAVAALPLDDAEDGPRRTSGWLSRQVMSLAPAGSAARLHAAALAAVDDEETGSERQLAAFRTQIGTAADASELRSLLDGAPEGITIDRALRWRILNRLAGLGAIDRAELQAAFDADPAVDAQVALTAATCALPDAEAKAHAWSIFLGETAASNYEIGAAGGGLWQRGQESLTAPYVSAYFDAIAGTATVRSGWVLGEAAAAFFPAASLERSTLAQAQETIADPELAGPLRRRLRDLTDELGRLIAVKERFAD